MPIPLGVLAVAGAGAAGGGGSYDLLETTVLGTAATSVSFTGLGSYSAYKHLQIRAVIRGNSGGNSSAGFHIRLNSDTGNNYAWHRLLGNGSGVFSDGFASQSDSQMFYGAASGVTANIFGAGIIDILDFNNTSKNTTIRALGGVYTGSDNNVTLNSGLWNNTAAVTTINLRFPDLTGIAANSRFSLYGIK
jgi:hypothetical protein